MQSFSLHTDTGELAGFLTLLPDPDYPESGLLAVKTVSDSLPESRNGQTLHWRRQGDAFALFDGGGTPVGTLRQERLLLDGCRLTLNDLCGNL